MSHSEGFYRDLVERAGSIIACLDTHGCFTFVNTFAERFYGYEPGELLGQPAVGTVVPPVDEAGRDLAAMMADLCRRPDAYPANESESVTKDGRRVWVAWTNNPVYDQDGDLVGVVSVGNDATERRAAQEALRASDERLRQALDHAPFGAHLYELQPDGRLVLMGVNAAADRIIGEDHAQLVGRTIEDVFPHLASTEEPAAWRRVAATGEALTTESVHEDEEGITRRFEVYGFQTGPRRMAVLFRDITQERRAQEALRESEARYRALLESSLDAVLVADAETLEVRYANSAASTLLGYEPAEFLRLRMPDLHPPEARDWVRAEFAAQLRGERAVSASSPCLRKDGSVVYADISAGPATIDGRPCNVGFFRDVTERRAVEAERSRLQAVLQETTDFVAIVRPDESGLWMNRAGREVLGWGAGDIEGHRIAETQPPWAVELVMQEGIPTATREGVWHGETALLRADGTEVPVSQVIMCHRSEGGEPEYLSTIMRDISERKRREAELRRTQFALDRAAMPIAWFDADCRVVYVNDAATLLTGYSRDELLRMRGTQLSSEITDEAWPALWEQLRRAASLVFEAHLATHGGGSVVVECVAHHMQFEGEEFGVVFIRDLTERLQAEEALRESETRFRLLAESVEDALWRLTPDGVSIYASPAFSRMTGYATEEVVGVPLSATLMPESVDVAARALAEMAAAPADEPPRAHLLELQFHRKDGSAFWGESVGILRRDAQGRPLEVVGVTRDTTERRRAEEALRESETRFRLLAENVEDVLWRMTPDGVNLYVSPAFCRMTGYRPEEAFGAPLSMYIAPDSLPAAESLIAGMLATPADEPLPPRRLEVQFRRKDGSLFWAEAVGILRRDEDGQPLEIVGVTRDLTERRKAEAALRESEARLRVLADNVQDVLWWMHPDGTGLYTSPAWTRITGFTPEETAAIPFAERLTPDSATRAIQALAEEMAAPPSMEPRSRLMELEWRCKDGSTVWLDMPITMLPGPDGRPAELAGVGRDLTARRAAEAALRRTQFAMDRAAIAAFWVGPDGRFVYVNDAACRSLGYSRDELLTMGVPDIDPDFGWDRWPGHFEELRQSGSLTFETQHRTRDGHLFPVEMSLDYVAFEGQEYNIAFARDLTAQREAERAMRESEAGYRLLAESISDLILLMGLDGTFTYANPSVTRLLGYDPEQFLGLTLEELLTPASLAEAQAVIAEQLATVMSRPRTFVTLQLEMRRRDGSTVWTETTSIFVRDPQGQPTAVLGVARDITDRRRAEAEQRRLVRALEQAADAIMIVNTDLVVEQANAAVLAITGYAPEELRSQHVSFGRPEGYDEGLYQDLWAQVKAGQVWRGRLTRCRKDGALYEADMTFSPVRDAAGSVTSYIISERDVTERAAWEAQLRQSQKLEAIGTLAGGVAHDFNNLLTAILGYADLLQQADLPGAMQQSAAAVIAQAAERAAQLTQQLLGFARATPQRVVPVDVNAVIKEIAALLSRTTEKRVSLHTDLAAAQPFVEGDPVQIQQVLLNLAINARDAMPEGGQLSIGTAVVKLEEDYCRRHAEAAPGQYVLVSVTDEGVGIPAAIRDRIFEPFFTTKGVGQGTGMGLAVVYGIVREHRGFVQVYSEEGYGTTFKVYLPHAPLALAETDPVAAMPLHGAGRILVVDDEEVVRKAVSAMLRHLGYEVVAVAGGRQAVELYREAPDSFDLAVIDLAMPGMDGRECYRALRSLRPDLKALLASGLAANGTVRELLAAGMVGFVSKPYNLQELSQAIAAALGA